jgi:MFS family permease
VDGAILIYSRHIHRGLDLKAQRLNDAWSNYTNTLLSRDDIVMTRTKFPGMARRISSTPHYQTFPVKPPTSRGNPPRYDPRDSGIEEEESPEHRHDHRGEYEESPLPTKQLVVLAVIALAEQTALNSISPYLPEMAASFPEVDSTKVGLYVGLIASSFALAQFATGYFWGWLSDQIGRKPVVLSGTILTAACFLAFGFCKTLWQAVIVQMLMGLVNGNQGVISTCLGEITDRSNQSRAFVYLPVIYGIGGITGPVVGALLVSSNKADGGLFSKYPYLPPNLLSAGVLIVDMIITMLFLEESLEEAQHLPPLGKRVGSLFTWIWQFTSSSRPSYLKSRRHGHPGGQRIDADGAEENDTASDSVSEQSLPTIFPESTVELTRKQIFHRDTVLLLITYLVFQLANVSFNSLYPIFASAPPPTGRGLSHEFIGLSLAFAGIITIVFQVGIFGKIREKMGNKATYRASLVGFVLSFTIMPFVGYKDGSTVGDSGSPGAWLSVEIGFALLIKTVAAVGGLTSALLLASL